MCSPTYNLSCNRISLCPKILQSATPELYMYVYIFFDKFYSFYSLHLKPRQLRAGQWQTLNQLPATRAFPGSEKTRSPRIRRISNVIEFYTYILNAALGSSMYLWKWSRYGFWNEMLSKAYSYFTFRAARRKKTGNPLFLRVLCIRDIKRRFMVRYSPRWFGIEEFSCFRLQKTRSYIVVKCWTKF